MTGNFWNVLMCEVRFYQFNIISKILCHCDPAHSSTLHLFLKGARSLQKQSDYIATQRSRKKLLEQSQTCYTSTNYLKQTINYIN